MTIHPYRRLFDGLPVVIVQDWREVGGQSNPSGWLRHYGGLTDQEYIWNRLDPDRVIETIHAAMKG